MNFRNIKKVLVMAAHPDDEVLGSGGVMAHFAEQKTEVQCCILATGATSRFDKEAQKHQSIQISKEIEQLKDQASRASAFLGASPPLFFGLQDQKLDLLGRDELIKTLKAKVQEFKPEIVFTHHVGDYNFDHTVVHHATVAACRPCPGEFIPQALLAFEVPSSTEWSDPNSVQRFIPQIYFDITKQIDKKIAAMECYVSELRKDPHPRSAEVLRSLAKIRGSESGYKYAEAFQVIRWRVE